MSSVINPSSRKGAFPYPSIRDLLDRLETYKGDVNLSAETEEMFKRLLDNLESRAWIKRNSEKLVAHGKAIAETGLAGHEFERI